MARAYQRKPVDRSANKPGEKTRRPLKSDIPEFDGLRLNQKCFLRAYIVCGTISDAAKSANLSRHTHFDWMRTDDAYIDAFNACQERRMEMLEAAAFKRALKKSDTLMIFLLKAADPEKYRDNFRIDSVTEFRGGMQVSHTDRQSVLLDEAASKVLCDALLNAQSPARGIETQAGIVIAATAGGEGPTEGVDDGSI